MSHGAPGLYLHIPFCSAICPYCDFAVRKGKRGHAAPFVDALVREMRGLRSGELLPEAPDLADLVTELVEHRFDTVYFGGGTPTFLDAHELGMVFDTLFRTFHLDSGSRFYLECNPEDVTAESLRAWRELGVSTLSLGVQSLDDKQLQFLGRRHRADDARAAVDLAMAAGFETVSVDLIYGLPGQPWKPGKSRCDPRWIWASTTFPFTSWRSTPAPRSVNARPRGSRSSYPRTSRPSSSWPPTSCWKPPGGMPMKYRISPALPSIAPGTTPNTGTMCRIWAWVPRPTPLPPVGGFGTSL